MLALPPVNSNVRLESYRKEVKVRKLFSAVLAMYLSAGYADDIGSLSGSGAWSGSIGNAKVNVCFGNEPNYYYIKHMRKIDLEDKGGNELQESVRNPKTNDFEVTGRWVIVRHAGDKIEAVWTDANGGNERGVMLTRLSSLNKERDCGGEFYGPIIKSVKYKHYDAYGSNGNKIKIIESKYGKVFELGQSDKGSRKINEYMHSYLYEMAVNSYNCGYEGGWREEVAPLLWKGSFLVVKTSHEVYCGGPYPDSGEDYDTWDLSSGVKINILDFIKNAKVKKFESDGEVFVIKYLPDSLRSVVLNSLKKSWSRESKKEWDRSKECVDVIRDESQYQIRVGENGFIFSPVLPHAVQACGGDIEVGYGQMMPFLNQNGLQFVRKIQAN